MKDRKNIIVSFITTAFFLCLLLFIMKWLTPIVANNNYVPGFIEMIESAGNNEILGRIQWYISDITEATFNGAVIPSIVIIIVGIVVNYYEKKNKVFLGVKILGGSGLFAPVLITSLVGLMISNILYYRGGWSPTFTAYVSMAPILIQVFGHKPAQAITIAILAGVANFPIPNLIYEKVAVPLNVPGFAGVAIGMAITVVIATELCNFIPWLKKGREEKEKAVAEKTSDAPVEPVSDVKLFFSRLLGDPGEAFNWGTPAIVISLYVSCIVSWLLNPNSVSYASGRFPMILFGGFLTGAVAIFIWFGKYKRDGFAFTFTSVICANSVFNTYDLSIVGIIGTILVSATVVPFIVHYLLEKFEVTKRWHPAPIAHMVVGVVAMLWSLIVINIPFLTI